MRLNESLSQGEEWQSLFPKQSDSRKGATVPSESFAYGSPPQRLTGAEVAWLRQEMGNTLEQRLHTLFAE